MKQFLKNWITAYWKRALVALCMVGLYGIDLVKANGNGDQWRLAINCVGICVFPMVALRFSWKDMPKWPYLVWCICFSAVAGLFGGLGIFGADLSLFWLSQMANVLLYGIVLLRFIVGRRKLGLRSRSPLFYLWCMFLLLAGFSVNDASWPFAYLFVFGSFYLAPKDEDGFVMEGIIDGMILSFFIIQIHAFLYRPYDYYRYRGFFSSSLFNAIFYYFTYIALLVRLYRLEEAGIAAEKETVRGEQILFLCKKLFCFLLAGAVLCFAMFTTQRSPIICLIAATLVYLLAEVFRKKQTVKQRMLQFLGRGILLTLVFLVSIPIVYASIRYIPALRHHPVWFGDYGQSKVMSWDPIDSEKYISLPEFFGYLFGRLSLDSSLESDSTYQKPQAKLEPSVYEYPLKNILPWISLTYEMPQSQPAAGVPNDTDTPLLTTVHLFAAEGIGPAPIAEADGEWVIAYEDGVIPGTDADHPVFLTTSYHGAEKLLGIRKYIYLYYLSIVRPFGNEISYPTAWLTTEFWARHAHNSFLQIACEFGALTGILFTLYVFAILIRSGILLWKGLKKQKPSWTQLFVFLSFVGIVILGTFECEALPGQLPFTMLFLLPLEVFYGQNSSSDPLL